MTASTESQGVIAGPDRRTGVGDGAHKGLGWRRVLVIWAIATLGLFAVFWQTAWSMVLLWADSSLYGHCFLIVPASAYLVWVRRAVLKAVDPVSCLPCAVAVVIPAAAWLLGNLTGTQIVQQTALVVMFQLLTWATLGTQVVRILLFPLAFLFFAVPFGAFLIPPLQDFTAQFVVRVLQLTGMPVYIDGWMIHIPSGRFHVAEACAGLSFLISTLALGFLASNLMFRSFWRRLLFIGLAVAIPIVANGFRAYGIVMIAHLSNYQIAVGVDHLTYGLIFLSIVTFCLLGVGMTFRERDVGQAAAAPGIFVTSTKAGTAHRAAFACLVAILSVGLIRAYALYTEDRLLVTGPVDFPQLVAPKSWNGGLAGGSEWRPRFESADKVTLETFTHNDMSVGLFVALYSHQRQGHEVVSPTNSFAPNRAWAVSQGGQVDAVVEGEKLPLGYLRLQNRGTHRLVWYWYWVDGRYTANPYVAKLLDARAKLLGGDSRAAVIALSTIEDESPAQAGEILQKFLDDAGRIRSVLEATSPRVQPQGRQPG